jgi:hypothetical protein
MEVVIIPDINKYTGDIPSGSDLMIFEKGNPEGEDALILYGFDEIGMFDHEFKNPTYGFMTDKAIYSPPLRNYLERK